MPTDDLPNPPTITDFITGGFGQIGTGIAASDDSFRDVNTQTSPGRPTERPGRDSQLTLVSSKPDTFEGVSSTKVAGATMTLSSAQNTIEMMYAPSESIYAGLAQPFTAVPRPGRQGLVLASGEPVPEFSFTLMLGYVDPGFSIEPYLIALRSLATTGEPVAMEFGRFNQTLAWRITAMTENHKMRNLNGYVTRAEVDITLTAVAKFEIEVKPMASSIINNNPIPPVADEIEVSDPLSTGINAIGTGVRTNVSSSLAGVGAGLKRVIAGDVYDAAEPPIRNPNDPPAGAKITKKSWLEAWRAGATRTAGTGDTRDPFAGLTTIDPDPHA